MPPEAHSQIGKLNDATMTAANTRGNSRRWRSSSFSLTSKSCHHPNRNISSPPARISNVCSNISCLPVVRSRVSLDLCLLQAVYDKTSWLAERGIEAPWPVAGLPETLHADNGPDFRSRACERACRNHGHAGGLAPSRGAAFQRADRAADRCVNRRGASPDCYHLQQPQRGGGYHHAALHRPPLRFGASMVRGRKRNERRKSVH